MNGARTLFECNQFRIPTVVPAAIDDNLDEPSESSVTRKRPIQQEQTSAIPKK